MRVAPTGSLLLLVALLISSACAPTSNRSQEEGSQARKSDPKVITTAAQVEPAGIHFVGGPAGGGTGDDVQFIFQDDLFVQTGYERYAPQLATELPSFERGTWRLNPDGTMDTIWKLHPNVFWHD